MRQILGKGGTLFMQKMKRDLYNKIIESADLSKLEIRFLILLASICNESGQVIGAYYKSIAKEIGCTDSKFYHLRDSLTEKGFITWEKNHSADIDIKLVGNNFMVQTADGSIKAEYNNYVDLNISIFQDKALYQCKAGTIRMAMEIIKRVSANEAVTEANKLAYDSKKAEEKRKLWYQPYREYKTLADKLKVQQRMIKKYIKELKPWITLAHNIEKEARVYDIITVKKAALEKVDYEKSQKGKKVKSKAYAEREWYMHFIKSYCRRNKIEIKEAEDHLSDTAELIKQYRSKAGEKKLNILTLICKAIRNASSAILNSYHVHKALRNLINYNS